MGLSDLNQRGYVTPQGPVLADTAWNDVLVVLARSVDGQSLDLVLEPRDETFVGSAVPLGFDHLRPGARYHLVDAARPAGQEVFADAAGRADAGINLDGPRRLRLEPVDEASAT
jgi:hypothetical protein